MCQTFGQSTQRLSNLCYKKVGLRVGLNLRPLNRGIPNGLVSLMGKTCMGISIFHLFSELEVKKIPLGSLSFLGLFMTCFSMMIIQWL